MIKPQALIEIVKVMRIEAAKPGREMIINRHLFEMFADQLTDTAHAMTDTCLDVLQVFEACAEAVRSCYAGGDPDTVASCERQVYQARKRWLNRGEE